MHCMDRNVKLVKTYSTMQMLTIVPIKLPFLFMQCLKQVRAGLVVFMNN